MLPEGYSWQLGIKDERAFVYCADHNPPAIWVNGLMNTSLWKKGDRFMLFTASARPDKRFVYLDEIAKDRENDAISMILRKGDHVLGDTLVVKIMKFKLPRDGASIFWELRHIAGRIALHTKDSKRWLRENLRRRWLTFVGKYGVSHEHIIPGYAGACKQDTDMSAHCVQFAAASTRALITLATVNWHEINHPSVLDIAKAFISELAHIAPPNFSLWVGPPGEINLEVTVVDYVVQPCPGAIRLTDPVARDSWPSKQVNLRALCCDLAALPTNLVAQLVEGIAEEIDARLVATRFKAAEDLIRLLEPGDNRVDDDVRLALESVGRNSFQVARLSKTLLAKARFCHRARNDHHMQQRYFAASNRAMSEWSTVAILNDDSRFSKKDWKVGCWMNVTDPDKKCGYLIPQDHLHLPRPVSGFDFPNALLLSMEWKCFRIVSGPLVGIPHPHVCGIMR